MAPDRKPAVFFFRLRVFHRAPAFFLSSSRKNLRDENAQFFLSRSFPSA